jgi:hypothetical protein
MELTNTRRIAKNELQPGNEPAGALRDYGRLKLELAGVIPSVRQMAEDRKDKDKSNLPWPKLNYNSSIRSAAMCGRSSWSLTSAIWFHWSSKKKQTRFVSS